MSELKLTYEEIVDRIREEYDDKGEDPPTEEDIDLKFEELCELDYLVCEDVNEGEYGIYRARAGLKWCDFHELSCHIKKQILLYLVENPNAFVVLLNTQRGKSAIIAKHMREWTDNNKVETNTKIVPILFVDNDRTLAEQSEQSLGSVPNKQIFQLSSNTHINVDQIKTHIDAWYSCPDYETPIIMSLPNTQQITKVVRILDHIVSRNRQSGWNIKFAIIIDEFDKVYPLIRPKLLPFIAQTDILHRIGWISATAGNIDEYPECANAYFESHPEDSPDYRAFHHPDSVIKIIPRAPHTRGDFIKKILTEHRDHFWTPIVLNSGEEAYRRIIVNSDTSRVKMEALAKSLSEPVNGRANCMTLNMYGLKLFIDGVERAKYRIRGCRLNEVIFAVFKLHDLRDKPLFIIGGRKVDRGLGFHYAPRRNDSGEFDTCVVRLKGETATSENGEGLIFTDEILGSVDVRSTAVQKAGRGAGVIAQCPQYCGSFHYWTNQHTADVILNHNARVDTMNNLPGAYTARQADVRGEELTRVEPRKAFKLFDHAPFETAEAARKAFNSKKYTRSVKKHGTGYIAREHYTASIIHTHKYVENDAVVRCDPSEGTHMKRRTTEEIMTVEQFERSTDMEWGIGSNARIMPVRYPAGIRWRIIYKPENTGV